MITKKQLKEAWYKACGKRGMAIGHSPTINEVINQLPDDEEDKPQTPEWEERFDVAWLSLGEIMPAGTKSVIKDFIRSEFKKFAEEINIEWYKTSIEPLEKILKRLLKNRGIDA